MEKKSKAIKSEQGSGTGDQGAEKDPGIEFMPGLKIDLAKRMIGDVLIEAVMKVDPEIRMNNPVWHWSLCDDHCTFVFRNGQKIRVEL